MFEQYTVLQGPAGHEVGKKRDWDSVDPDKSFVFCTIPPLQYFGGVDVNTIIYRFSHTFFNQPDKFYILLRSSRDRRVHVFQRVTEARGDDLASIYPSVTICFRSDHCWEPITTISA